MSCEFCEDIQEFITIRSGAFKGGYYPAENRNTIVHDKEDNSYHLWSDGGGDGFMSEVAYRNIQYCPYCGEKL